MALFAPLLLPLVGTVFRTFFAKAILLFSTYYMIGFGIALSYSFFIACCDISLPKFQQIFSQVSPQIWWFLELINFAYGFKLILCAVVTKWMVSWIPFSPK